MRTFGLASLLFLVLLTTACGNVFVRANWGGGTQTASGFISIVQLTVVVDDHGVSTQITVVTLFNDPASSTFSFCGDQRSQFPPNQFAQATFTPGTSCSTLLQVTIKG